MNADLDKLLCSTFPNLFANRNLSDMHSCMGQGFACGDGWFNILWELGQKLEPMGVKAAQVKEKFGTLRFYLDQQPVEADAIIRRAEERSGRECEDCGAAGHRRNDGWIRTLCNRCAEARNG